MGLKDWDGECIFVKNYHCPTPHHFFESQWRCMQDCKEIECLRTVEKDSITIAYGEAIIKQKVFV